eukprot:scaffold13797_cov102-Isochrysis_galbana.AAC.3
MAWPGPFERAGPRRLPGPGQRHASSRAGHARRTHAARHPAAAQTPGTPAAAPPAHRTLRFGRKEASCRAKSVLESKYCCSVARRGPEASHAQKRTGKEPSGLRHTVVSYQTSSRGTSTRVDQATNASVTGKGGWAGGPPDAAAPSSLAAAVAASRPGGCAAGVAGGGDDGRACSSGPVRWSGGGGYDEARRHPLLAERGGARQHIGRPHFGVEPIPRAPAENVASGRQRLLRASAECTEALCNLRHTSRDELERVGPCRHVHQPGARRHHHGLVARLDVEEQRARRPVSRARVAEHSAEPERVPRCRLRKR